MKTNNIFDIRLLKPFHREGAHLPGTAPDEEDKIAELDPNLKPEEHSYVNHYVNYADVLLEHDVDEDETPAQEPPEEARDAKGIQDPGPGKVVEMPRRVESKQSGMPQEDGKVA
ncbi:MAG TPA: hypothetical protein VI685_25580 [Candidatus Angelobacter sp.]